MMRKHLGLDHRIRADTCLKQVGLEDSCLSLQHFTHHVWLCLACLHEHVVIAAAVEVTWLVAPDVLLEIHVLVLLEEVVVLHELV